MIFPSPDDPVRAPVWENYIVAQAVQASLSVVPRNALAVGVEVAGTAVQLRFQLSALTDDDALDMKDIVDALQDLVGDDVEVGKVHEVTAERHISPLAGVRWIFLART